MRSEYLKAKGWLTTAERKLLRRLAEGVYPGGVIINIGVEYGASLHCLRHGSPGARIVGVDIIGDERLEGDPGAEIIKSTSYDYLQEWGVTPINLLFVDGDHSYEGVQKDCLWADLLVAGGVVVFHDCYVAESKDKTIHNTAPGVNRAVSEWAAGNTDFTELESVDSCRVFIRLG